MDRDAEIKGASKSLEKTINELIEWVDERDEINLKHRRKRDTLAEVISQLVTEWFEYGFQIGHETSYKEFIKSGTFPKSITHTEREWEIPLDPDREIEIQSEVE